MWYWLKGTGAASPRGFLVTLGTYHAANEISMRASATLFLYGSILALFGGTGYQAASVTFGSVSDYWNFNITSLQVSLLLYTVFIDKSLFSFSFQWKFVSGGNISGSLGVYGDIGEYSPEYFPPGRDSAASRLVMIDGDPYFFVYGGKSLFNGLDFNDVFVLDVKTDMWALIDGQPNRGGMVSVVSTSASSAGASDGYSLMNQVPSMSQLGNGFQRVSFQAEFQKDLTEVYFLFGDGTNDLLSITNP